MRRRGKVAIGVLVVVLGVPLVALLFLYASLSGGWDDAFRPKKSASSKEVREAREKAEPVLAAEAKTLGVSLGEVTEHCAEGQHNWKIDDDYDISCEVSATTPLSNDPTALRALHQRLVAAGWRVQHGLDVPRALETNARGAYYERGSDLRLSLDWGTSEELTLAYRYYEA